jgi:hypothetical protein
MIGGSSSCFDPTEAFDDAIDAMAKKEEGRKEEERSGRGEW